MRPDPLGILLISGTYERAHYALMLAAAAAAIGRPVVLFATNRGCHALCEDWSGLDGAEADAAVQATGVAGLETLIEAARELKIRLWACTSGLAIAAIAPDRLRPGVTVTGLSAYLAAIGDGQLTSL